MSLAILYLDESGVTNNHPAQTTHYVLAGVAILASDWARRHDELTALKQAYGLDPNAEIHCAWLLRPFPEQLQITGFDAMNSVARRREVLRVRALAVANLEARGTPEQSKQLRTLHRKTTEYVHLNLAQRQRLIAGVVQLVQNWPDTVLFGESIEKRVARYGPLEEAAFEQVVSRFEAWLVRQGHSGVVAYDLNDAVYNRITALTARIQRQGGVWRRFAQLAGHPFFVDSRTSSLVQAADVVAYALRRYSERGERALFDPTFGRFDTLNGRLVGLRHYRARQVCPCVICAVPR
jgi:hypothetical protein